MVVVPAVVLLDVGGASELAAPDDEGLVEHPAFLEILQEGGEGLVDAGAVLGEVLAEAVVLVPVAGTHFDEAHAGLGEAAGEEALAAEVVGVGVSPIP